MSNEFFVANRSNCHSNLIHLMYDNNSNNPAWDGACPQHDG